MVVALLAAAALNASPAAAKCKHSTVAASAENEKEDQARENAVSAWEDKTRDLYGKGWAYWTKSTNRRVVCQPLVKNSVSCTATANPCFYPMGQD